MINRKKVKKILLSLGIFFLSFLIIIVDVPIKLLTYLPLGTQQVIAQETTKESDKESDKETEVKKLKPFATVIKGTAKISGLFTLYRHPETKKTYWEITPEQLNQKFLCFITLQSGIAESILISGMPLADILFELRRDQNQIQFVIPNINFRNNSDDPQSQLLKKYFSDSILYSLPIKSIHPERKSLLVDLGDLLMGDKDLSGLQSLLSTILDGSYSVNNDRSYFGKIKAFPSNVEIESIYNFSDDKGILRQLPTLADSRAFDLRLRYSFSQVPVDNGYRPRLADERVGYFITAYKDLSDQNSRSPFIRYINRWNLQKQDPSAAQSVPVEPLVFWIENTVPKEYREAIAQGVLSWNKAFEKIGFIQAIQVKQMPDDATWDPADIRYNTIRWSSSLQSPFMGFGPSRINPATGQILDADVIIDGNIIRNIKSEFRALAAYNEKMANSLKLPNGEVYNPCQLADSLRPKTSGKDGLPTLESKYYEPSKSRLQTFIAQSDFCFGLESSQQLAVGAISLALNKQKSSQFKQDEMENYVNQFLQYVVSHEVGHTLGLRHNFHGSTLLSPEELGNPIITEIKGLTGSVMDYLPVNLASQGKEKSAYFPRFIGPYDEWAIEYGYTPIPASNSTGELSVLRSIASKATQPELAYATDEDIFDRIDPNSNIFDHSKDVLGYAKLQLDNTKTMWSRLESHPPATNGGYGELRSMFDTLFGYFLRNIVNTTLHIGGQSFNRSASGDINGKLPFSPIPISQQREALSLLQKYIFAEDSFNFSPDLLNKLAPSRWMHWGNPVLFFPLDYPISDRIQFIQRIVFKFVYDPIRLTRLRDMELKAGKGNFLSLPELFETVQNGVWSEVLLKPESGGKPKLEIGTVRRSLQREHLAIITEMVLRESVVTEDAQTLAWYELRQLRDGLNKTLKKHKKDMDLYTKAHLEETLDRVNKVLNAQLESK